MELIDKVKTRLNVLDVLCTDIEASIEQIVAKFQAERMLQLGDIKKWLEAEKVKSQH